MDQLKKELKLLYNIDHNNIIKIIGVEKTINNIYIILEHCNGGSLLDFVSNYKKIYRKNLPEKLIQKILNQIIKGLKFMHGQNIIHRDIKLENILINFDDIENNYKIRKFNNKTKINFDNNNIKKNEKSREYNNLENDINDFIYERSGSNFLKIIYSSRNLQEDTFTIKIADLGYARELDNKVGSSSICGSPLFMAPDIVNLFNENIKETKNYNLSVDIWSLGTVLYELLIGNPPFVAYFNPDIFKKIIKGMYELPINLSISVEALNLLTGLLNYYPEKRFTFEIIEKEPFITKFPEEFHFIQINALSLKNENLDLGINSILIDTKNRASFLKKIIKLFLKEKIDIDDFSEEEVYDLIYKLISEKENFKYNIYNYKEEFIFEDSNKLKKVIYKIK
jgi:serine/threonine-protein kinase ULK/ATG1